MPDNRTAFRAYALVALVALMAACRGEPEVSRAIEVREPGTEQAQAAGAVEELVAELRILDQADRVIYQPPVDLARPAGATEWPPPTGAAVVRPPGQQQDTLPGRTPAAADTARRDTTPLTPRSPRR